MARTGHFSDDLDAAVRRTSPVVVGIDPDFDRFPPFLRPKEATGAAVCDALLRFTRLVTSAVSRLSPAVKFQSAYFERFGTFGVEALAGSLRAARDAGFLVILDVKRGDIGPTSLAYAEAYLSRRAARWGGAGVCGLEADAVTVNPFLGDDAVRPFVDVAREEGKGLFVLVRTSNPGSGMVQSLPAGPGRTVARVIAEKVAEWGSGTEGASGLSLVGAVVGATYADEVTSLRGSMPAAPFLLPGVGAQGGGTGVLGGAARGDGSGAVVSVSRGVTYPETASDGEESYEAAVRAACRDYVRRCATGL